MRGACLVPRLVKCYNLLSSVNYHRLHFAIKNYGSNSEPTSCAYHKDLEKVQFVHHSMTGVRYLEYFILDKLIYLLLYFNYYCTIGQRSDKNVLKIF